MEVRSSAVRVSDAISVNIGYLSNYRGGRKLTTGKPPKVSPTPLSTYRLSSMWCHLHKDLNPGRTYQIRLKESHSTTPTLGNLTAASDCFSSAGPSPPQPRFLGFIIPGSFCRNPRVLTNPSLDSMLVPCCIPLASPETHSYTARRVPFKSALGEGNSWYWLLPIISVLGFNISVLVL